MGLWGRGARPRDTNSISRDTHTVANYIDNQDYLYVTVYNKWQYGSAKLYTDYVGIEVIFTPSLVGLTTYAGLEEDRDNKSD